MPTAPAITVPIASVLDAKPFEDSLRAAAAAYVKVADSLQTARLAAAEARNEHLTDGTPCWCQPEIGQHRYYKLGPSEVG